MNKIHGSEERMSRPENINFETKVLASWSTAEADTFAYIYIYREEYYIYKIRDLDQFIRHDFS